MPSASLVIPGRARFENTPQSVAGKVPVVVQYRTFRNTDPPGLAAVWNQALTGRSAVPLPHPMMLEHFVFAKPYFDPAGLIVAHDNGRLIGFAHAGFGANGTESTLAPAAGVLALVAVLPAQQRRGIGSELLRRAEDYLRQRGAQAVAAGSPGWWNPFYQGLYGGSESIGVLASDVAAGRFLTRQGYQAGSTYPVLHRRLTGSVNLADGRFASLRRRFELRVGARPGVMSWWRECVLGPLEMIDFRLEEKLSGDCVGRGTVWEMDGFSRRWNEPAIGLVDLEVQPELRRQGVGKFLLAQTFRYLQDQYFGVIEVQLREASETTNRLFRGVGFAQVDMGCAYSKPLAG